MVELRDHRVTVRRVIRVTGTVQGVGFRPFVHRTAVRASLRGWVRNSSGSVEIDVEGPDESIEAFLLALRREAPALARVISVTAIEADPTGCTSFEIAESRSDSLAAAAIPADVCTCPDCLRETNDPADRRFTYPFTNCTNCGPRFTIVRRLPYDRPDTTMAAFDLCEDCGREYRDPANRRFHAEPIACPVCGPQVWLETDGRRIDRDPIQAAGKLLHDGKVVAIKGLGGFHLACDARSDEAVHTLRSRKGRAAKPFALMVKDIDEAARLCELDENAADLLMSPRRPIVILRCKPGSGIPSVIAPGNPNLGIMLPYTALHALLFDHSPPALVMTSGNLSEEPLVFTNASAREKLAPLVDAYLMHDRDIHVPCDDSVVRPVGGATILVRRARGFVPEPIELPVECASTILALGAEQKSTFCLAWDSTAVPSQHIGDLDTVETFDYYRYAIDHFQALLRREPDVIAHDLHPAYLSTQYALERSPAHHIAVQHHHAHIAACLAENGRTDKCIGLALDGTGYGPDSTVWGGEVLLADLAGFERIGHLKPVLMPGGEAAIRDPRRMAAAYLHAAYGDGCWEVAARLGLAFTGLERRAISHELGTGLNSPPTSSAGRLFDAVSATIGVCRDRTYEGQPAIELEMTVDEAESGGYSAHITERDGLLTLDGVALFHAAVEDHLAGVPAPSVSARFHAGLVSLLAEACRAARERTGLNLVALSGGVLQNAIIHTGLVSRLYQGGFEVLVHRLLPPNDACISLGQAAIAAAGG